MKGRDSARVSIRLEQDKTTPRKLSPLQTSESLQIHFFEEELTPSRD